MPEKRGMACEELVCTLSVYNLGPEPKEDREARTVGSPGFEITEPQINLWPTYRVDYLGAFVSTNMEPYFERGPFPGFHVSEPEASFCV